MSSRFRQTLIVFGKSKENQTTGKTLIVTKKTGYVNLWINGTHYYYDEQQKYDSVKDIDLAEIIRNSQNSGKKGTIIIRKK